MERESAVEHPPSLNLAADPSPLPVPGQISFIFCGLGSHFILIVRCLGLGR